MMASKLFSADEVLQMALRIEHHGVAFYQECLGASSTPEQRDIFQYLIDQEHNHIETFTRMKETVDDYLLPESYEGESLSYVKSFIKDSVFTDPAEGAQQAKGMEDPFEVIEYAIGFEKASIDFYSSLQQLVRSSERDSLEAIIEEEHSHVRKLLALREQIESKQGEGGKTDN
jgi:rubrerythrin